jgi:hypothetical protein
MSEKAKKAYLRGNTRKVEFNEGAPIIGISINLNDFLSGQRGVKAEDLANEGGWINIDIQEKAQPDDYGNTHNVWLNTWKPDPAKKKSGSGSGPGAEALPF